MARMCKACARNLKPVNKIVRGAPAVVQVCKSPICRMYGKAQ